MVTSALALLLAVPPQATAVSGALPLEPGSVTLVREGVPIAAGLASVQAALDLALDGDELWLSEGRFAGSGNVDLTLDVSVALKGVSPLRTVVDGGFASQFFEASNESFSLESMKVVNCRGDVGGAVLFTGGQGAFRNVVFQGNASDNAGAIAVRGRGVIEDCVFRENFLNAPGFGAAVTISDGIVRRCRFRRNHGDRAGALWAEGTTRVEDCLFLENRGADAGAVSVFSFDVVEVDRCTFLRNRGTDGGSAVNLSSFLGGQAYLSNSLVAHNVGEDGPSVVCEGGGVFGCTIVDNVNLSTGSAGLANRFGLPLVAINTILQDNTSAGGTIFEQQVTAVLGSSAFAFCNIRGSGGSLPSVLDVDALFADPGNGNYRLLPASPCRDAGNTSPLSLIELDLDGQQRFQGSTVDIGAYEVAP